MATVKNASLHQVVTLPEAQRLWNKSRKTITIRMDKGEIAYRKTVTGGSTLIEVKSLIKIWGKPDDMTLWEVE